MIEEKLLKNEEKAIFTLRSLYRKYGYLPFKMSKFEEYDLYVRNKDFLVSDRVITFNDTNGRLLALKPDVTLSIIKNGEDVPGYKQKVYYNENVYRVSGGTHQYKEIMQTGLECIGDIDVYDVYEVLLLAAKSLAVICDEFVLDISHLGILEALLEEIRPDERFRREIVHCIGEKNAHDIAGICKRYRVSQEYAELLRKFVGIYGDMAKVLTRMKEICINDGMKKSLRELEALFWLLRDCGYEKHIRFDFSVVNDMNYYNGIVFKGFLNGICEGVLSGGQYDRLMQRMGRRSGAIGFALYLDLLEEMKRERHEYDVDVLLLYGDTTPLDSLREKVAQLTDSGKTVSVQKNIPAKLRYRELADLRTEEISGEKG